MYFARRRPQAAKLALRRRCWSLVPQRGSHGAPAVWLGAKGMYPICPMLRRRYLASLSLSRYIASQNAPRLRKGGRKRGLTLKLEV